MSYILLIEDDRDIRETTLEFLSMENIEGIAFGDAVAALEYLTSAKTRRPSIILTDINMPKMDGPTFRRKQLEIASIKDIPCVALSADPRADQKFADLKLAGVLRKPIDLDQLLSVIQKFASQGSVPLTQSVTAANRVDEVADAAIASLKKQHDLVNELSAAKMLTEMSLRSALIPDEIRRQLEKISEKISNAIELSGAAALAAGDETGAAPRSIPTNAKTPGSEKSILLIDDSPDLRELFTAYLTPRGFKVRTAHDVDAAIEILKDGFPALLLIDFHLGDKNVYHALDRLESECPGVFGHSKVVLFSATSEKVSDARIFAYEPKARDLRGIEAVARKYT